MRPFAHAGVFAFASIPVTIVAVVYYGDPRGGYNTKSCGGVPWRTPTAARSHGERQG
jgi:hypothetical protein